MPYLLDTVTISAFRRKGRTPPQVLKWSSGLDEPCHFLSVISLNELRFGIRADFATPYHDSLVAATAKIHKLTLATRSTTDFAPCGISMVNPWEE